MGTAVADPGNAPPQAWSVALPAAEVAAVRAWLRGERDHRKEIIARTASALYPVDRLPPGPAVARTARTARAVETCAPVIEAEMVEWISVGGSSSGCVGNQAHDTGYHRGASYVPTSDYSRRRDPNGADGPYTNWSWACAGDFRHGGKPALRAMHAHVLDRLMDDDPGLRMICEFIVQPRAGHPVMYWARWEGTGNLREYTGSGHDLWSHCSWFRSRANQRPYLWRMNMPLTAADKPIVKAAVLEAFNQIVPYLSRAGERIEAAGWGQVSLRSLAEYVWEAELGTANTITVGTAPLVAGISAVLAAANDDSQTDARIATSAQQAIAERAAVVMHPLLTAIENRAIDREAASLATLLATFDQLADPITKEELLAALQQLFGDAFARAQAARAAAVAAGTPPGTPALDTDTGTGTGTEADAGK